MNAYEGSTGGVGGKTRRAENKPFDAEEGDDRDDDREED